VYRSTLTSVVMEQVQPTCIIMSTRVHDSLLDKVKQYCKQLVSFIDSPEPVWSVFMLHSAGCSAAMQFMFDSALNANPQARSTRPRPIPSALSSSSSSARHPIISLRPSSPMLQCPSYRVTRHPTRQGMKIKITRTTDTPRTGRRGWERSG
jgi:hypothetical protein